MTYIEREALMLQIAGVKIHLQGDTPWINGYRDALQAVSELVQIAPAADVVKVVRCRDCKYWSYAQSLRRHECNIFNGAYNFIGYPTKDDDFCSYGEKQEG